MLVVSRENSENRDQIPFMFLLFGATIIVQQNFQERININQQGCVLAK